MTQSSMVSITFSFCLMPAYAHIQLRERTHIEGSGGEREVGREVRGEEGEGRGEPKSTERTQGAF